MTAPAMLVDFHVHLLGNGRNGSGCWLKLHGRYRLLARYILRHLGLPAAALDGDLERLYVSRLLEFIRDSPLDRVVLLAHDNVYDDRGQMMENVGSFYVPNELVLALAAEHTEFIPAVSIHPARADALDELERAIDGGAKVMKCLPNCHNIDCSAERYRPFWMRMAEVGMVLLAHTGGELSVPVVNPAYASPAVLRLPLECGVTVVAAHSGSNSGFFDPNYFPLFETMLDQHRNLFGDNSALNSPLRSRHLRSCLRVKDRIVHGSDLPIPIAGAWAMLRGLISWGEYRRIERNRNPLARDYELKRAMGFPDECSRRGAGLLR